MEVLRKIWRFAGDEQGNIRKSMVLGFFYAIFHMFQVAAIYVVVPALADGSTSADPAWEALALLLVRILGRAIMNRFSQLQQTHAGYFMAANKRLHMGDKLKRIPMGYFNDQSLGELTGIATTVLDEVESAGAMALVTINVDPENEDRLQKAMEALTHEKTVLMIAHRLKTVRSADQILVLDQGRIVQRGIHGELIAQEGIYRDFVFERAASGRWTLQ